MTEDAGFVHPYIPNAAPVPRRKILDVLGVADAEALYDAIPASLRLHRPLDLPAPIRSEQELRRYIERILAKNAHAGSHLSFLGGGSWQHYVPAVCDEIAARGEFLTAYGAWPYSDHGKFQAMFEYQSLLGELLGMEVVSTPTYDAGCAAGSALLMACRLTGRAGILVAGTLGAERLSQVSGFTKPAARLATIGSDPATGLVDLAALEAGLSGDTAAVYFENPGHLGTIETEAAAIAELAHQSGALVVVCVDPSALGVLAPPSEYGADIAVGELQPLGVHMLGGGGLAGFIACRDDPAVVAELPTFLISMVPARDGQGFGFGVSTMERTSYDKRAAATDYYGTTQWLWGIVAGVYLSLMGPRGMRELGLGIMQRAQFAAARLGRIKGVAAPRLTAPFFKEFVVDFTATGRTAAEINRHLLTRGIFGGKPLGAEFPGLGESALYCVTELHRAEDIERLASAIEEAVP
jgi:glycine dehydrogenase subunit 1